MVEFIKEAKVEELLKYEIVLGIFDDKDVTGYADQKNNCIVVSNIGIEKGVNYLLEIIIEEYIHLKYNAKDCSRDFQNACIQEMVKVLKIKNAIVL